MFFDMYILEYLLNYGVLDRQNGVFFMIMLGGSFVYNTLWIGLLNR